MVKHGGGGAIVWDCFAVTGETGVDCNSKLKVFHLLSFLSRWFCVYSQEVFTGLFCLNRKIKLTHQICVKSSHGETEVENPHLT